ncbi:MAG: hypothetical protein PHD29_09135 [bacterium]|nr:hypothetical protein [bacterium]MDD5756339.1 hypothetical protein [bacterium]
MKTLKLLAGLIMLMFSVGYLFRPDLIIKVNDWGRSFVFNDKYIMEHRRKIGVLFLVLAFIAIYMSVSTS